MYEGIPKFDVDFLHFEVLHTSSLTHGSYTSASVIWSAWREG